MSGFRHICRKILLQVLTSCHLWGWLAYRSKTSTKSHQILLSITNKSIAVSLVVLSISRHFRSVGFSATPPTLKFSKFVIFIRKEYVCALLIITMWGGLCLKDIYNCKPCERWHYLIFGYLLLTKGGVIKKH